MQSYANDVESKREKFCLITWIGEVCDCVHVALSCFTRFAERKGKLAAYLSVSWIQVNLFQVMRKARLSVQKADVQKVLRAYSLEVSYQHL